MSTKDNLIENRLSTNQKIIINRYQDSFRRSLRLFKQNTSAMFGLAIIGFTVFMAIFAPLLAPYEPTEVVRTADGLPKTFAPPDSTNFLGTTNLGNDVFSQWIYGSRVSLIVGILSGLSAGIVGTAVGLVSGYYRGIVDMFMMRIVDVLYAIPATPLVLIVAMFYGSSVWVVVLAFVLVLWRSTARAIRAQTLSLAKRPFVKSAKAAGAGDLRIMIVHILPNLLPLILIEATFITSAAIVLEAGISFLGLGATEMVSWGVMLQLTFTSGAIRFAWWWVIPPGLSITILVLSVFYVSRGIEEITNPEIQRR